VAVTEIIKLVVSLFCVFYESGWQTDVMLNILRDQIWRAPMDTLKVGVPAFIYTVQNNLLYVATTHLDAATTQVTYQLKILTTALFSVAMLHTKLTFTKWLSLVILVVGVALVQWPSSTPSKPASVSTSGQYPLMGLLVVLVACLLSGFAGIYFEKILKKTSVSVWVRNIQLGFFGTALATTGSLIKDGEAISQHGFFQHYDMWTWLVIIDVALGGLIVALVVKYADNILKGFATSISVVLSTIFSILFLDFLLSPTFTIGSALVLTATFLFSQKDTKSDSTSNSKLT